MGRLWNTVNKKVKQIIDQGVSVFNKYSEMCINNKLTMIWKSVYLKTRNRARKWY